MNYTFSKASHQLQHLNRYLPGAVVVLLSVYLLHFAAELTWRLMPAPSEQTMPTPIADPVSKTPSGSKVDLRKLQALKLFGEAGAAPAVQQPVVQDAPETNLNLTLAGVVASSEQERGAAIVENRGQQNTYGIGDKIDGTNVTVAEIHADRILIKNGARTETLMLDGIDFQQKNPQRVNVSTPVISRPVIGNREASVRELADARRELTEQPANFTDFINVSPQADNDGNPVGYRVSAGKKPALFRATGLQSEDIVTEINGMDLTDPQQAMEAMAALKTETSLQLTVLREGQLETVFIDLPGEEDEDAERQ
ncbi:type II secretion system protein GspC [Bowmanella sp. JS7-9]|uniref:Type II secretion system protein GspC n=1 Tax=Pseudobowmanella zhangzhouensis TaxID=1537679 RepID=A0ABW1XGQ3_9ALTE|nr:type II secretion system protein GspC [Bowmanella sp. JS7-9]TBX20891.1 hypothetical protein TK45_14100 [Bowmanella sp. JS7-9]